MSSTTQQTGALASLAKILNEASGFDIHELDHGSTFLELGFDSLFLIQFSQKIKNQLKVKVTFRQLIEELPSIEALVDHIATHAPSDLLALFDASAASSAPPPAEPPSAVALETAAVAASQPLAPQVPAAPAAELSPAAPPAAASALAAPSAFNSLGPGSLAGLEQIITQQNQLMALQLQLLTGGAATATASTASTAASIAGQQGMARTDVCHERDASRTQQAPMSPAKAEPREHPAAPQPTGTENPNFERFGPYKPVRRSSGGGLTEQQQQGLDALISRFTNKTTRSRAHAQRHRPHFADPRGVAGYRRIWKSIVYQIAVDKSQGSKLWDVDGNEYIDIAMGFGLNLFGQSPPFITEALHRQLDLGVEVGPQSPLAGEVAQLLCDFSRKDRATFCNTGSEAVMAAMRLARTVTGKPKVVFFNKDYHGNFDEVLLRSKKVGNDWRTMPAAPGVPQALADNAIVLNYGTPESLQLIAENADEVAAVLVEPVQSADPFLQPREYLRELRKITRDNDIAMVMDEVITGFRAGQGGAQEFFDVWADMATYGKILGGGLPIGALAGTKRYMDALDGGMWNYEDDSEPEADMTFFAGTFVRHPLAMVAAHQVLMKVKEEGPELQQKLSEKTAYLADQLNTFFEEQLFPIRVAQFTSLFRFMFPADLEYADLLYFHLLDRGIFTRGWADNCFLSTAHTDDDVQRIIQAVKESCHEIRDGGFIPLPEGQAAAVAPLAATRVAPAAKAQVAPAAPQQSSRFPLTETQQEILLTSRISAEADYANNEPFTLRLTGPLNLDILQQAMQTVFARHAALHVKIDANGEYQEYCPPQDFPIIHRDLSHLSGDALEQELLAIARRFASTPFDLQSDRLVRIEILKLRDDEHLLFIDGHHIVTDGWSWNVMLVEMGKVYSATLQGAAVELDDPASFRDYVLGTPERDAEAKEALAYWLKKYEQFPTPMELPLDHSRPAQQTYHAHSVIHNFEPATYQALKKIAATNGVSLFTAGLAAYKLLLSKLSGQDDLVVGMRTAGQSLMDNQNLVGLCMNVLPMRTLLAPEMKFNELLKSMQSDLLEAFEHQDCTLGRIVRNLKLPRQANRMPLTDVHFNLDRDSTDIHFSGLQAEVGMTIKEAINHDLFFNLNETPTGLKLYFDFNRDLFDPSTIRRWIAHYEAILHAVAERPAQSLAEISLLTMPQRQQVLVEWNATQADYPSEQSITQLFESQVERTPQAVAVVFEGSAASLDYRTLNARANQLARHLQAEGVERESYVGIFLERSERMVIAALAVLKCGATYVPMDPEFPAERLQFMAEDSGLRFLLTQSSLASREIAPDALTIAMDVEEPSLAQLDRENLNSEIEPQQIAYVIYTSGSTGRPKGVQVAHRGLTNFLCSMQKEPGIQSTDTLAGVTTLSFDIAGLELYLPLITGARLLIVGESDSTDGRRLARLLERHDATILQATPATWRLMIESGWQGKSNLKMLCGGEALPAALADALIPLGGELWNLYGPTETTIWSTVQRLTQPGQTITIGRPIANTQIYILDSHRRPSAIGVPGNLFIGGDGLALGYLNRPELTAAKFVTLSIDGDAPQRVYDTGDQARYLANGEIDFLGRSDHQVKISGYRIELGEIESVLDRHEQVAQSVVSVYQDALGHKRLVAYVKTQDGSKHYTSIRDFLRDSLPAYMLPSAIEFLDSFPLTPNGKVDRKRLPNPSLDRPDLEHHYIAARTPLEQLIASTFQEVVQVDRVGVHDNFFELGGHSLTATQVVARLSQHAAFELTIADIFDTPTVAELAEKLDRDSASPTASISSTIPRAARQTRQITRETRS